MGTGKIPRSAFAVILGAISLSGCCFNSTEPGCKLNDSSLSDPVKAGAAIDGNASALFGPAYKVLRAQCVQCHTGFGSYTEAEWLSSGYVVAGDPNTSPVYNRLKGVGLGGTENMPPGGTLAASDRNAIKNWISGLTTTTTTGAASRLAATFTVLGKKFPVGNQSCLTCHSIPRTATSGSYAGAVVPSFGTFTKDNDFVTSGLAIPGNPSISWIYRSLRTHGDIATMPKGETTSVSASDAAILNDWITNLGNP